MTLDMDMPDDLGAATGRCRRLDHGLSDRQVSLGAVHIELVLGDGGGNRKTPTRGALLVEDEAGHGSRRAPASPRNRSDLRIQSTTFEP